MSAALATCQIRNVRTRMETRCEAGLAVSRHHHLGWTDLINTHMSARIPGEPNTFLINNYGEMFDEVTASSLVKMDMDGNVLSPRAQVQQCRLHHPQRRLQGRARFDVRAAHPHARRRRGVADRQGPAPDQPGRAGGI